MYNYIGITFDTVTASGTRMHRALIILTVTVFLQGHTELNYENNKCSTILETVQAMPSSLL